MAEDSVREYNFRYSGTSIGYKLGGVTYPFYISEVEECVDGDGDYQGIYAHGRYSKDGENKHLSIPVTSDKLDFNPPSVGFVNYDVLCTYISYSPTRQYRKGLTGDRLNSEIIGIEDISVLHSKAASSNLSYRVKIPNSSEPITIHELYNKNYPTYEEAYDSVITGERLSVAFSDDVALCAVLNSKYPHPVLYYKTYPVGSVVSRGKVVLFKPYFSFLEEYLTEVFNLEVEYESV